MRLKLFILFSLIGFNIAVCAQEGNYTFYLDKNLAATSNDLSVILGIGNYEGKLFKLDCYNKFTKKLILTLHCTDSTVSELNGSFVSYHKNGGIETEGLYKNNVEEGPWLLRDTIGLVIDSSNYSNGLKISHASFTYLSNKKISSYAFTDTLKNTYQYISFDSFGIKQYDANFIGNNGIYNSYDSGKLTSQKVYSRELIEAKCNKWSEYLRKNLNGLIPTDRGAKSGIYKTIIRFTVEIDGTISNIVAETNFGFGMEDEGIRVVKNGPNWTPAMFFGIPIKAIRRQPITFVVSGSEGFKSFEEKNKEN